MPLFFIIVYIAVLVILLVAGFVVVGGMRSKGAVARALNMTLLQISVPRDNGQAGQQQRPEKELIAVMEQLYNSITNIHASGWNKFIYGEPYAAFEMAVPNSSREIHFYAAVPRSYQAIFEKQVHGLFPTAEISAVTDDYSIFHPHGAAAGAAVTLKSDPILPIKTYQVLQADPLGEILASLSKIEESGEGASIQILVRPSHKTKRSLAEKTVREMQAGHKFSQALARAKSGTKDKEDPQNPQKPRSATVFEEELMKAVQAKASKPLFDANIRLIVSASDQTRADQLLNDLSGSLVQFSSPDMNSLGLNRMSGRALKNLLFNFTFRMFDDGQASLLSSEELSSLFHFPIATTLASNVKFLKSKSAEPPANLPREGIVLGKNVFRGQEQEVRMTDADRRRHLYVIGQTGTGKSVFLESMVRQDIENGKGVCVIDPHGEFAQFALSIVPEHRAEDVIYFDPGHIDRPMGLNMLEIDPAHPEQKTMVIDELFGIFDRLYDLKETGGPMFERYFKNSALLLLDDYEHEIPTLADIARVLTNDAYRADKLSRETNPLVKQFWQEEAEKAGGEAALANMAPYISSKVTAFVFNEFLRPIINQKHSAFNFREAMDSGKILIVNLSKGRIGDLNANLLGMIIVGKLLMAALSRTDLPDDQRRDFYLYVDEFQNFTTDAIATILSEARKYRLDLIVAHQFIKQLTEKIRDAVFGNIGSIVSFRIGADDAEFMKNKFEPVFSAQDLMNIDNLNAHVNLLIDGQTARPFNMRLETERVFGQGMAEWAEALKKYCYERYGRDRAEVEAEIANKY
ncbi:MAG TPA: DUF87 domain-containing protein [Candidatus Paceibacterota bacterium]|nr:DUF87 domain-containing protein [Candidatus Paceibacterota bacterium]